VHPDVESIQDLGQLSKLVENSESTGKAGNNGDVAGYLDLLRSAGDRTAKGKASAQCGEHGSTN